MINHQRVTRLVFILVLISLVGAGIQSSPDLFQKALRLERSEGDLRSAIAVYKQIVEKNDDEALAAQAQFRIGVCLEKLGRAEARAAFQLVVDRYPKQTETVREARDKIAALFGAETARAEIPSAFGFRRIWEDAGVDIDSRVSPDGRHVAYRQAGTGNLAVRDLQNGMIRLIRINPPENIGRNNVTGIAWSFDGSQLAYLWGTYYSQDSESWRYPELHVYDFSTMNSKFIPTSKERGVQRLFNWTSDGSKILIRAMEKQNEYSIGFVSLNDGTYASIMKADGFRGEYLVSPEGRWIAMARQVPVKKDERSSGQAEFHSLSLSSLETIAEKEILSDSWAIRLVGWTANADRLFFLRNNTGKWDLYALLMKGGILGEEVELIRQDVGDINPLGLTLSNEISFVKTNNNEELHSFGFDTETGRVTEPGRVISRPYENCPYGFELSPDGRSLAYVVSEMEGLPNQTMAHIKYLCVYFYEDGRYREFGINERSKFAYRMNLKWLNSQTVQLSLDTGRERRERTLDLATGRWNLQETIKSEEIDKRKFDFPYKYIFASNEKFEYQCQISRAPKGLKSSIIQINRGTKEEVEICSHYGSSSWYPFVSPDQKYFALVARERGARMEFDSEGVVIVSLEMGRPRNAFVGDDPERHILNAVWTPDSRGLVLSQIVRQVDPTINRPRSHVSFWYIPRDGGPAKRIEYDSKSTNSFGMHLTDGQRVVFKIGSPHLGEIWVMENALKGKY